MPVKETAAVSLLTPKAMLMNFLIVPFALYMHEHGEKLTILIVFMVLDFATGIMKSRKLCKKITRYKLEIGFYVKLMTFMLPFLFDSLSRSSGYDVTNLISFSISTFILIEFYSIVGNIYTVRTGKEIEDKDFVSYLLLVIRNKTDQAIQNRTGKDDDKASE